MANYSLVAGPRYNPLDFDTTLKVLQLSQARHDELEEAYGELGAMSDTIGGRLDEKADPIAYARWKQYNDALNSAADDLSMYGLNPQSRRTLMDTRRYYGKQVAPIDLALQNRTKIQDEARKQLLNNPTWYTENDVLNASVDRWLENEGYDWGKQYSGAMLTQQVSTQLAPLAKVLRDYGKGIPVDKYTDTFIKRYGVDVETAYRMMMQYQNDPEHVSPDNIIAQILNNVVDTAVGPDWDESTREAARRNAFNYAQMGITSAIGQDEVQPIENFAAREDLRHTNAMLEKGDNTKTGNYAIPNPTSLYVKNKDFDKKVQRWSDMFTLDERTQTYVLNKKGKAMLDLYYKGQKPGNYREHGPQLADVNAYEFYQFLKNDLGWDKKDKQGRMAYMPGNIGNAYTRWMARQGDKDYDTHQSTYFPNIVDDGDSKYWVDALSNAYKNIKSGAPVVEFGYDKNGRLGYYVTGNVKTDDIDHVTHVNTSFHGNTATVKLKNGKIVDIQLPNAINKSAMDVVNNNMRMHEINRRILKDGRRPELRADGTVKVDSKGDIVFSDEKLTSRERDLYDMAMSQCSIIAVNALVGALNINDTQENKVSAYNPFGI